MSAAVNSSDASARLDGGPVPSVQPVSPVIDARNVSKWYGDVVAVNDVSVQIYPGIIGLLGPNGAGKTTFLHLISGLAGCSEGSWLQRSHWVEFVLRWP